MAEQAFFILRDKTLQRASETLAEQAILAICSRVVEAVDTSAPEPSLYNAVRSNPTTSLFWLVHPSIHFCTTLTFYFVWTNARLAHSFACGADPTAPNGSVRGSRQGR